MAVGIPVETPSANAAAFAAMRSALGVAPVAAGPANYRGSVIGAGRGQVAYNLSSALAAKTTFRSRHYMPYAGSNIRLVYANIVCDNGGSEAVQTTSITVTAALEVGGTVLPAKFNGAASVTIEPQGIVISDPIPFDVAAGTAIYARQTLPAGTLYPAADQAVFGSGISDSIGMKIIGATNASPIVITATGGGHNLATGATVVIAGVTGNTAANGTFTITKVDGGSFSLNGTTGNGAYAGNGQVIGGDLTLANSANMYDTAGTNLFMPIAILITPVAGQKIPYVVILGDSIGAGSGDTASYAQGWVVRGLGGAQTSLLPYTRLAVPGTRASQFASASAMATQSLARRFFLCGGYVIDEYGINDLFGGTPSTLAQFQADKLAIGTSAARNGARYIATTLLPQTDSSDNWATAANQSTKTAETNRTTYNNWLRAGAPIVNGSAVAVGTTGALLAGQAGHPFWAAIDPCVYAEVNAANVLTLNGGRWIANGTASYPTTDGTHPSTAVAILASAAVPVSSLVGF